MDQQAVAQYKATIGRYLPPQTVDSVFEFMNSHAVRFHITRDRQSKLGDYRWPQPHHPGHEISVNGTLNPYMFLMVLLHEMAHLLTRLRHGDGAQPHGHEWQEEYRQLLTAYASAFPNEVQPLLKRYTRRIPLSRPLLQQIEHQLATYDKGYDASADVILNDLEAGTLFALKRQPERLFRCQEKRRTRWLCVEVATGRPFLVSGNAPVVPHQ